MTKWHVINKIHTEVGAFRYGTDTTSQTASIHLLSAVGHANIFQKKEKFTLLTSAKEKMGVPV